MDPEQIGQLDPGPSWPLLALAGSAAVAGISVLAAALDGAPYLSLSSLSPWIALFAVAACGALFAIPFAVNRRIVSADPSRAEAWEGAMLVWAGVAVAVLAVGALMIWAGGYSPANSLADAVGLLLVIEAGIVVLVLAAWMLAG